MSTFADDKPVLGIRIDDEGNLTTGLALDQVVADNVELTNNSYEQFIVEYMQNQEEN